MAELIAVGTAQADSADFTNTSGTDLAIFLKTAASQTLPNDAKALIQVKSSEGAYFDIGVLTAVEPMRLLSAPGTFRVRRLACAVGFGVDKT